MAARKVAYICVSGSLEGKKKGQILAKKALVGALCGVYALENDSRSSVMYNCIKRHRNPLSCSSHNQTMKDTL